MIKFRPFGDLLELVFPSVCPVCQFHMCETPEPVCFSCAVDMPRYTGNAKTKLIHLPSLQGANCLYQYRTGNKTSRLVKAIKYTDRPELARWAGRQLIHLLPTGRHYVLAPVPLHRKKKKKRGFNQSERLAQAIAEQTGHSVLSGLERVNDAKSQTKRSKLNRWLAMSDVFRVQNDLTGKSVVIVDDVLTTGATVSQMADALSKANAEKIYLVCLAGA